MQTDEIAQRIGGRRLIRGHRTDGIGDEIHDLLNRDLDIRIRARLIDGNFIGPVGGSRCGQS